MAILAECMPGGIKYQETDSKVSSLQSHAPMQWAWPASESPCMHILQVMQVLVDTDIVSWQVHIPSIRLDKSTGGTDQDSGSDPGSLAVATAMAGWNALHACQQCEPNMHDIPSPCLMHAQMMLGCYFYLPFVACRNGMPAITHSQGGT